MPDGSRVALVVRSGQTFVPDGDMMLMAGDVVFAEGGDVAATALHQVEAARA